MREPAWLHAAVVRAVHSRQTAEHGGPIGVQDPGLLESALAHPRHVWNYEESATVPRLAAAYGYSLTANHPFTDGNKRVALVGLLLFLDLNGWYLSASEEALYLLMLELAAGNMSEEELTVLLGDHCRSKSSRRT